MPAWAPGSWAADAWAGTAWDETAPTVGTAWFASAWAPGAWGSASWAGADAPPPVPWDLDVPTLGPQLAASFAASGNFGWGIERASGTAALSATFSASGNFQFIGAASPFNLAPTGPVALSAQFEAREARPATSSGRIIRRGRTKFPKPLPVPEEETPAAPVSLLDTKAMELTIQQGVAVYRKRRVAILKRKLEIEVSDERAIEDALLELF